MKIEEFLAPVLPTPEFYADGERFTASSSGGLVAVPNRIAKTINSGQPQEDIGYGLTLSEKQYIGKAILNGEPIGLERNRDVYKKFLGALFPNNTLNYLCLMDYSDAKDIIVALGNLFPDKKVRLPNKNEAITSIKDHNCLNGYIYEDNFYDEKKCGYAWIGGKVQEEDRDIPIVGHDRDGRSHFWISHHKGTRFSCSVIPVFE